MINKNTEKTHIHKSRKCLINIEKKDAENICIDFALP